MARKRKNAANPNQYSLFDLIASSIEEKQENALAESQSDSLNEAAPDVRVEIIEKTEPIAPEPNAEPVRLGINADGASVYRQADGSRMVSNNLAIMRVVDGDKRSPEDLYVSGRHEFLTVQETAYFRNETNLVVENANAGQQRQASGHRQNSSQAGNNHGREKRGLHQPGLLDFGSLGVEQPG